MAIIGGIRVYELVKDFSEGIGERGPVGGKSFLVPNWADRYQVTNTLLGLATYSGGTIGLVGPKAWPESSNMLARSISIRGVGSPSQGPKQVQWEAAVVAVEYGVPQFSTSPGQDPGGVNSFDTAAPLIWATQRIRRGTQVITIPRSKLKTAAGNPIDQDVGRPVGVNTLSLTLHRLPYLVSSTVRAMIGKLNTSSIFGCPAGTLMLAGIDTDREFIADGTVCQETTYTLLERPEAAWDKVYTGVGTSGWEQAQSAATGSSILKSDDFSTLIPTAYHGY